METKNKYLLIKSKSKYCIFICLYFFLFPISRLLYGRKNNWLLCERGNDAQDNGFVFYKYLTENHPEINPVYLIKRDSPEYDKISRIGKKVEFGSVKHLLLVIGCPVKISSSLFGYAHWVPLSKYYRRNKTKDIHVFLQHGVIKNIHEGLFGDVCNSLDLFVCGARPEYDFIYNNFHYKNSVPQYTGLARYDLLADFKTHNQIIIMPTWRASLNGMDDDSFLDSSYCKSWLSLINNKQFIQLCKNNNLMVKFYLHYSFQQYSHLFKGNDVVNVVNFGDESVQDMLKESKLLITDFSSVYFDFGYMKKPVVHFQFDEDTFYDEHYTKGYFDYRRDGFGDVCLKTSEVIDSVSKLISNNFCVEKKYLDRMNNNFIYRDTKNCERIFNRICELINKK